jgi:ATP-dependent Clp protease protease subunit
MAGDEEKKDEGREEGLIARMVKTRTILVAGEIDDKLAEKVMSQLLILDADNHDSIRMIITTQGGHIDSGFAIHDTIRYVESRVITLGAGWVASIGVPILLAADKADRYALPNTRFLLHQPSGGAGGQATDIRIAAEEILRLRERINQLVARETGQSVDKVAADSDRNFWMSAEEALDYGLVATIIQHASEIS